MNEIEDFLEECANDPYFRVHPEQLKAVRATITELSRNENYDALPTLGRVRKIAAQTERSPRQRCKEIFPVLLRALEQEGQSPVDKFDTMGAQVSEAPTCGRDSLISDATRSLLEAVLVLQGRVKALELIAVEAVKAIARSHVDPDRYTRQFVERTRIRQMGSEKIHPTDSECEIALLEILTAIGNESTELALPEDA